MPYPCVAAACTRRPLPLKPTPPRAVEMCLMKKIPLSLALMIGTLVTAADVRADDSQHKPTLTLESAIQIEWERVEGAFRYRLVTDGSEIGSGVGNLILVQHEGSLDDLTINAYTMSDEAVGEATLVSIEEVERLVLRWDESAFERPFLGLITETPDGSRGRLALELQAQPHIVSANPEHITQILFGEAVTGDAAEGRTVPSPFELTRRGVVEHGPFFELELP